MIQDKFIVKIPTNETEYKETRFKTQQEVCEFLDIKPNTLYSFMSGRLKLKHRENHKLKGIIIERINLNTAKPKIDEEEEEKKIEEYKKKLLEKMESK